MKIGIDIMGGDLAPHAPMDAALKYAVDNKDDEVFVFGSEDVLKDFADGINNIKKVYTTEVINVCDDPAMSIRRKKDSSLVVGAKQLANKEIDAFVSAGSTGAIVSAGYFIVKRIEGVERPALPGLFPTNNGEKTAMILDVGANADAKADHLHTQAKLGLTYMKEVYKIDAPKVALLNIGAEEKKGTDLYKETYSLLSSDDKINFIGNIEARDIFNSEADVIVVDGFTGNMVLKSIEGTAKLFGDGLKSVYKSSIITKLAYLPIKSKLSKFKKNLDYKEIGGTPLFGIKEVLIKAHGSSNDFALYNALKQAKKMKEVDVIDKTQLGL